MTVVSCDSSSTEVTIRCPLPHAQHPE